MIIRFNDAYALHGQEYWEWIQWSIGELSHPLYERFKTYDPHPVLVSSEELDLIIEAVTESRLDWEFMADPGPGDEEDGELSEQEWINLKNDIEMISETLDFLNELLVTK